MFLSQTMLEYLDNPMGKGSTAIGNRALIKNDLDKRYEQLLSKHKDFVHKQYVLHNIFYIHILIPSESKRSNTYDVVIELTPPDGGLNEKTLKNYEFRVFSNCPSFVYTYGYVYDQYGLVIDFLRDKYSDVTLNNAPEVKNPGEIINYDKSIYFACKYITSHSSLMNVLTLLPQCKSLNKGSFTKSIRTPDNIMLEIQKENNRLKDEEKKASKKLTKEEKLKTRVEDLEHRINQKKYANRKKTSTQPIRAVQPKQAAPKRRPQPKTKSTIK